MSNAVQPDAAVLNMELAFLTPPFGLNLFFLRALPPLGCHHGRYIPFNPAVRGTAGARTGFRDGVSVAGHMAPGLDDYSGAMTACESTQQGGSICNER
jgi:hypothetical protein